MCIRDRDLGELDRNQSIIKERKTVGGNVLHYHNQLQDISFDIPYRWNITEDEGDFLNIQMAPKKQEHNSWQQIERSGFIPQVDIDKGNSNKNCKES